jgi:hypothetical protein
MLKTVLLTAALSLGVAQPATTAGQAEMVKSDQTLQALKPKTSGVRL